MGVESLKKTKKIVRKWFRTLSVISIVVFLGH